MAHYRYPFPPQKFMFPIGMIGSFVMSYLTFRSGDSGVVLFLALIFFLFGLQELTAFVITLKFAPESLTVERSDVKGEMVGGTIMTLTPGSVSMVFHSGWLEVLCGYTTIVKTTDPNAKRIFLSKSLIGFTDFLAELQRHNPNMVFTGEQL